MRGLVLFVAGAVAGLAVHAAAQNQTPNRGIVGLNHVALSVPDIDKAVTYYTKTMGFPEAFRVTNPQGEVQLVYVQISQNTFIELQPANPQRPPGINHFGLHAQQLIETPEPMGGDRGQLFACVQSVESVRLPREQA